MFSQGVAITIHKEKYGIFSQLYKRDLSSLSMYGAKSKFFMLKKAISNTGKMGRSISLLIFVFAVEQISEITLRVVEPEMIK